MSRYHTVTCVLPIQLEYYNVEKILRFAAYVPYRVYILKKKPYVSDVLSILKHHPSALVVETLELWNERLVCKTRGPVYALTVRLDWDHADLKAHFGEICRAVRYDDMVEYRDTIKTGKMVTMGTWDPDCKNHWWVKRGCNVPEFALPDAADAADADLPDADLPAEDFTQDPIEYSCIDRHVDLSSLDSDWTDDDFE